MGARSRRKGHSWEREVVRRLRAVFGDQVRRGLQYRSGEEQPDVIAPRLWIECKAGKKTNPRAALRQAQQDAQDDRRPVAVCKDDRQEPFVIMSLDTFVELADGWYRSGERIK
jgi:hypothetical protein